MINRRYILSSSFKMAALFTVLLSISLSFWIYILIEFNKILTDNITLEIAIIVSVLMMLCVIATSFFISIFVVKRINHIANTAGQIIRTGDLSRRINVKVKWDDLSNLGHILNALLDKVEQLMQDIKSVSDNIAHDLKTPLTRLLNNMQQLDKKLATQETKTAIQECEQLLQTFNALLRISYIEYGKHTLKREFTSFTKIINDAITLYEPLIEKKHIELIKINPEISLYADRDLIFQVIANLLDNACKFTPEHGQISIQLEQVENTCQLQISDSGPGICAENNEKIFKRFFREEASRSTDGSGLGLALSQVIITQHKGNISAKPHSPTGLTIAVSLPIH